MNWPFLSYMYLLIPSYSCLPLLCSISHCKDPFMSKSAWPGDTPFVSHCDKLHPARPHTRFSFRVWEADGCGQVRMAVVGNRADRQMHSPSQVPGKTAPPRPAANSPQKHLAVSADRQPQRLPPQSSKHSCKLLDDHQGSETGGNGLGTAQG